MLFSERLKELLAGRKINWQQVSKELSIGKNQQKYWQDKDSTPDGKTLIKLAKYFNVTTDYLLGQTDDRTPAEGVSAGTVDATPAGLTEQEQTLVRLFRDTTEEGRVEMIAAIWNIYKERKNAVAGDDERAIS